MRLHIVTPAGPGSTSGNRRTALRYARLLRELGHRVRVATGWRGEACDALVALHARRSHGAIRDFRRARPRAPVIVVLTGTDLYVDGPGHPRVRASLQAATRIVTLQPDGLRALPRGLRGKAVAVLQSARRPARALVPPRGSFRACVLAHLRPVKDPLRAAAAVRLLPPDSRLQVVHAGRALTPGAARRARAEMRANARYRWLGELAPARALALLAGSRVLVQASRAEGGSCAISEALVCGVPVLASRIPGATGMLGRAHPGLFPAGDTRALARLLGRVETDPRFRARLAAASRRLAPRFARGRERRAWARLLAGLEVPGPRG